MSEKKKGLKLFIKIFAYIILCIILEAGIFIFAITIWSKSRLDVSLEEILFTLGTPLKDNGGAVIKDGLKNCVPAMIIGLIIYLFWVYIDCFKGENINSLGRKLFKKGKVSLQKVIRVFVSVACVVALIASAVNMYMQFNVGEYLAVEKTYSGIYADYYINPDDVKIEAGKNGTKNLICIYLESMENMYSSKELGGNQETNLIPNLTKYADENISFSNSETLGGFYCITGTTWTIASLYATTSGVPLKSFVNKAEKEEKTFASGITVLGDVLEEKGYVQEFLCGSDGDYAGRATYFKQHGNYKIFDLYTAREKGYIPEDYYEWWGYEDKYLFEIAKDELTKLAKEDAPFNFTMLTVDTHYPDGFVCELCGDEYDSDVKNVVACADKQIGEFIQWCTEQDFYEDTVIVMMGDHLRMDVQLMDGVKKNQRTMYNCIINSGKDETSLDTISREYAAIDMFPTILSAMGFEIEGDRLGLGTNLFSSKSTLMEELGRDYLEEELRKQSEYYETHFQ